MLTSNAMRLISLELRGKWLIVLIVSRGGGAAARFVEYLGQVVADRKPAISCLEHYAINGPVAIQA